MLHSCHMGVLGELRAQLGLQQGRLSYLSSMGGIDVERQTSVPRVASSVDAQQRCAALILWVTCKPSNICHRESHLRQPTWWRKMVSDMRGWPEASQAWIKLISAQRVPPSRPSTFSSIPSLTHWHFFYVQSTLDRDQKPWPAVRAHPYGRFGHVASLSPPLSWDTKNGSCRSSPHPIHSFNLPLPIFYSYLISILLEPTHIPSSQSWSPRQESRTRKHILVPSS